MTTPRMFRPDGLMSYHERNESTLRSADPLARVALKFLLYRWLRMGEDVLVTECFRNKEDQERELREGSSQVGWPYSFHNHGLAVDVVPVLFGQVVVTYGNAKRYEQLAAESRKIDGVHWGRDLWGFDSPHFHVSQGKPVQHFVAGGKLDADRILEPARSYYTQLIARLRNSIIRGNLSARRLRAAQGHLDLALANLAEITQLTAGAPSTPA